MRFDGARIRVSHGPIDVLGLAEHDDGIHVKPSVDLTQVKVGEDVRFALVQEHAGEYAMEQIYPSGNDSDDMTEVKAGRFPAPETALTRSAMGEIRRYPHRPWYLELIGKGTVQNFNTEVIAELKWPLMTMNFAVQASLSLDASQEGQNIHLLNGRRS